MLIPYGELIQYFICDPPFRINISEEIKYWASSSHDYHN